MVLAFRPHAVRAGDHAFDIGSAGSAALVLQAIVPALARLAAPSTIAITGGTHNPMAPPFEFLVEALAPQLRTIGWGIELTLARPGFYPAGGGRLTARLGPAGPPRPLHLLERGARIGQRARAVVAHVERRVAERELAVVRERMNWTEDDGEVVVRGGATGPGNYVVISLRFEHVTEVACALGERARPAEQVADTAVADVRAYLRATAPVSEHLCDQLLVPLAITAGGSLRATAWSAHTQSQRELLCRWFERDLEVSRDDAGVRIHVPAMT